MLKGLDYSSDVHVIDRVQFGLLSADQIRDHSVLQVTEAATYDREVARPNGLCDLRMGCIEANSICQTCQQTNKLCPGHFGHIELARPIYNYHFIKHVEKILKCVCFKCSKLLIDKESEIMKTTLKKNSKYKW